MSLEPGSGRRSASPESSGRDSPLPRQWRNQLGAEDAPTHDKAYRKYATGVERALSLFETALQEWADYISFLNRLLRALQARQPTVTTVPSKAIVAKRLSQCLNPSLPSGVHQKALEVYNYIFGMIGVDGLSRDLPLYLPGLASTLSFASLSVRSPYLDLLERHFLKLEPRSLRPAMKSIVLALLPGLEEETSEDFDRTMKLVDSFKVAIRPPDGQELSAAHSTGDAFFWQCFFLASITSHSRRGGALAYLVRNLPKLGDDAPPQSTNGSKDAGTNGGHDSDVSSKLCQLVTSPEPGLLLRCFAAGMADEQLLIQRGFLDLLVTHLPLHSQVLQTRVKPADLQLLLRAAAGVVTRREMSLNRRLWAWFLGPDPQQTDHDGGLNSPTTPDQQGVFLASKTNYFEDFGLQALTQALLGMIQVGAELGPAERARPYRICLSLMDRWEIGGLVVPEVFLPIVDSVRQYKGQSSSKSDFNEVFRSASVFFDGVESGLIYGEIVGLLAQALGPGQLDLEKRLDKLDLVDFILGNFNVREEEMITIHAPLTALSVFCMLEDAKERRVSAAQPQQSSDELIERGHAVALSLLELVPERAFPSLGTAKPRRTAEPAILFSLPAIELLKRVKEFYVNEQGNLDAAAAPFTSVEVGELLVRKAGKLVCDGLVDSDADPGTKVRILITLLSKAPDSYEVDTARILASLHQRLGQTVAIPFQAFSSILHLSTNLFFAKRALLEDLSGLVPPMVRHAWSYLAVSEPKYHVETVRLLWQLQSALSPMSRDIEASLSSLIVENDVPGTFAARPADAGRRFTVLWSHTLQDTQSDRRGSRTPLAEKSPMLRLSGSDHYDTMLTRPMYLMLDALLDERTQLFMTVKSWLNSMVGLDKLFITFVHKFCSLPYLGRRRAQTGSRTQDGWIALSDNDDLDLCLYYLRTLSNVFRWGPDAVWSVLASTSVHADPSRADVLRITARTGEIPLYEFFLQVCMRCIDGASAGRRQKSTKVTQLYRCALTTLHQILRGPFAHTLTDLNLEDVLIGRLAQSLDGPDPYVQVLLLDVTFATLKIKDSAIEMPASPVSEKAKLNLDPNRAPRPSTQLDTRNKLSAPPPALLKCLQAGLSAPSSRSVLDSWVNFLTDCLPLYADTVFQVLIPLVGTLCQQISSTFEGLQNTFKNKIHQAANEWNAPETTLISLLNALEQVLARGHERLLVEEARAQVVKSPDQQQSFFGTMVSGVFATEAQQSRSATANDRLTVHLAFQDAVRICFTIWSWGQGLDGRSQDPASASSFGYTSLRMRNRSRRLLEHLFAAETLECLETVIGIWRDAVEKKSGSQSAEVLNLLPALDGSRPSHTIPAIFNAIYSRTNPQALEPSRRSTLTISLQDVDIVTFLVEYAKSLEDDAMDEIWQDCMAFLRDLLANPFPHRQTLPSLLEFAAILGEKVDNTNFGEQRKMRRDLGDIFLKLLTAIFTTKPMSFADSGSSLSEKGEKSREISRRTTMDTATHPVDRAEDVVAILASIVPNLPKILVENDRVLSAAGTISANVVGPAFRAKAFPDTVTSSTLELLQELSRLPNNQKTWRKDLGDAFNDTRFFGSHIALVKARWLPLLKQWVGSDKERMPEILARITPPTTAGIVFGVGATSARLEADRKTQLNLRRIATLILAGVDDAFVADLPVITEKIVELLAATSTSSPSSTTRAEIFMLARALVLKTSSIHLAMIWPILNAELHAAMSSVVAADHSKASETYTNASILQACKLLDLLICAAPDDFQLHEWLFVTDTIDAVYRSPDYQPVALVDELSEELGSVSALTAVQGENAAHLAASSSHRRPLLGPGGINDDVSVDRKDELVAKVLRPFFGQLSIFAFESTYAMAPLDREFCVQGLLKDIFDERSVTKAL